MAHILELPLSTGRSIFLDELYVGQSYAGWLEGTPTEEQTRDEMQRISSQAAKLFDADTPTYVVPSVSTTFKLELSMLPPLWFCGSFLSKKPARDNRQDASCLKILWFQDSVIPIMSDENASRVIGIQWNDVARDYAW
jgi:hypothetical protein